MYPPLTLFRPVTPAPPRYQPIADIESWIHAHKITDPETLAAVREKNPPPVIPPKYKSKPVVYDSDHVHVSLRVTKTGVKIQLSYPWHDIDAHMSKGHLPPLNVWIPALHALGYPEEYLERVIARDDWFRRNSAKLDEFIESVFGPMQKQKFRGKQDSDKVDEFIANAFGKSLEAKPLVRDRS